MKASVSTLPFLKTAACPAAATLVSFRAGSLSAKATTRVREHLEGCDFCNAESRLLAHHKADRTSKKAPEMPINLRILAEAILARR
jgi:hypothetical protein